MSRKKKAMEPKRSAGVIPVELFPYVLLPERLERLKLYAVRYLAKYGIEEDPEAPKPEREAGDE